MRLEPRLIYFAASLLFFLFPLTGKAQMAMEQIQVPQCLAAKLTQPHQVLAENSAFQVIEIASKDIDTLATLADETGCGHFVNVSHRLTSEDLATRKALARELLLKPAVKTLRGSASSYTIKHKKIVNQALAKINAENILQTLNHLTSYSNRSATEKNGVEVAAWLKAKFEAMAVESGRQDTAAYFVETGPNYPQPSLVTVIGTGSKEKAIVIGAHMDTLSGAMPGADDDGSGSATVMEMARILLESPYHFKRPVYIIWYAAEERGLVGSQYVVNDFINKKIPVAAAIQFDMTGYRHNEKDSTMWIFRDFTDGYLNQFIKRLVQTYVKVPVAFSECGYGCSDHASWMAEGIPAAFPCEEKFEYHNPYIHTPSDTIDLLNTDHMVNFAKLALAFALELALEKGENND